LVKLKLNFEQYWIISKHFFCCKKKGDEVKWETYLYILYYIPIPKSSNIFKQYKYLKKRTTADQCWLIWSSGHNLLEFYPPALVWNSCEDKFVDDSHCNCLIFADTEISVCLRSRRCDPKGAGRKGIVSVSYSLRNGPLTLLQLQLQFLHRKNIIHRTHLFKIC